MSKLKIAIVVLLGLSVISFVEYSYFDKKLRAHKKKTTHRLKICEDIAKGLPFQSALGENRKYLPKQFDNIPFSNHGIVLGVKKLDIRNVFAPYNPAIIEHGDGYLVFFRYDIVKQMHLNFYDTLIGCAELDQDLNQTEKEFVTIDTNSSFCEDPRALWHNGNLSLIYNNLVPAKFYSRAMHIAHVDLDKHQAQNIQKIDLHLSKVEKNWAPFVYKSEDGSENILFEYQVMEPRQILKYTSNECPEWFEPKPTQELEQWCENWSEKWGTPLGGTGARLIDGEYLSFFHSKFKAQDGTWWYVMGAYTFESKAPFRITRVSTTPLFFDGIYETPALNTASPDKYVIFPCGFAIANKGEKTVLHLSCGENDSAIKIVSLDKDALVKSLKKL
ncbi:MAG: hypothetical protein JSS30_00320 [Verrucomicrobia bacterium]|nr:hypothetical protein [Verrucomicrobiota bacterium]